MPRIGFQKLITMTCNHDNSGDSFICSLLLLNMGVAITDRVRRTVMFSEKSYLWPHRGTCPGSAHGVGALHPVLVPREEGRGNTIPLPPPGEDWSRGRERREQILS